LEGVEVAQAVAVMGTVVMVAAVEGLWYCPLVAAAAMVRLCCCLQEVAAATLPVWCHLLAEVAEKGWSH
jgi:hypothetical protein